MKEREKEYDYLIVGAGLFGSVFAYEAKQRGKKCLVIDRRKTKGGNVYCEDKDGIKVHKYGAHIFHTNDQRIWDFVNRFVSFHRYTHSVVANYRGDYYSLPFNMNTFYQMWGLAKPEEVQRKIEEQVAALNIDRPQNLEEQALKLVGPDIYERLIKGYTEKQWGRKATELPPFIIKRLPIRLTFDNGYFNDRFQGIPVGGYNPIIDGLLEGIPVQLEADYFDQRDYWESLATKVIFTGQLDEYFNYDLGALEYRSLRFEEESLEMENYQGAAVVNYTDFETPFTRIIEHKHFEFGRQKHTVITREYPQEWEKGAEPYYPINDDKNNTLVRAYKERAKAIEDKVLFGGRLAEYVYYDMHQVIASARKKAEVALANS